MATQHTDPWSYRQRIVDFAWHQAHSYRLHELPADFTYITARPLLWNIAQREIPENFKGGIDPDDVQEGMFDFAISHLDQWCDTQNVLRALPHRIMCDVADRAKIPMAVIMHGTPDNEANRRRILELIGDCQVVCNSRQAAAEWRGDREPYSRYGFTQFVPIIHGYNVDEFYNYDFEQRERAVATICSGGDLSREYHGIPLIERLSREHNLPLAWYGANGHGNRQWKSSWNDYRDTLARMLIYFSPTRRGPMPGARTEAMLSGACIVSVPGNDWEDYIDNGKNGFIVRTYSEASDILHYLIENPREAYAIGQAGREMARREFHMDRYTTEWRVLIYDLQNLYRGHRYTF